MAADDVDDGSCGVARPPDPGFFESASVKDAEDRKRSAVSRISLTGSSITLRISSWKLLPIFFSSAYVRPARRSASGSFSGPSTTSASSRITMISLPERLNTRRSLRSAATSSGRSVAVQQRLPSLLARPIGFAHRGARAHAPENTLEAFQLGLRLGATGLESDVWLTSDGVPVLDHDGVVRRRHRRRPLSSYRRDELPEHIPSLAELVATCGTGYELSLDLRRRTSAWRRSRRCAMSPQSWSDARGCATPTPSC